MQGLRRDRQKEDLTARALQFRLFSAMDPASAQTPLEAPRMKPPCGFRFFRPRVSWPLADELSK